MRKRGNEKRARGNAAAGKRAKLPDSDGISEFCRPHFITISLDDTVRSAIGRVRRSAQPDHIFYLYVTNDQGELCGIVSIRSLLLADDQTAVSQVYSSQVVALPVSCPVEEAYQTFARSRFLSLPVVDSRGQIVGVVHAHEIAGDSAPTAQQALFEDRTRTELFELLGIKAEDARHSPVRVAAGRLPWLLVNISGGGLCAVLLHWMGSRLANPVEVLAFVPVLLVISESIGMQSASLAIANLHRSARPGDSKAFLREWAIAFLLGCACAVCLAGCLYFWKGSASLAATVALTVLGGCLLVSLLGNAVPYLFHRWKIDPRIAAGPVVLSLSDFSTLLVYLLIAHAFSGWH